MVYDEPRSGRPSELAPEEHDQFVDALHESPQEVGFDAPAWTVPLARQYLKERFNVEYCQRHVRRLLSEAGLSHKTARPEYHKSDERAQDAFREGLKKTDDLDDEYTVLAIDQTRQVLSTLIYAWFPEGERPSLLPVTGAWDSIKLLGAVSDTDETFFLPCEENFNSDTTIRLLDALQTEFGEKLCVVLDNASYFTAKKLQEFVADTPIELCFLPRGSAPVNPAAGVLEET